MASELTSINTSDQQPDDRFCFVPLFCCCSFHFFLPDIYISHRCVDPSRTIIRLFFYLTSLSLALSSVLSSWNENLMNVGEAITQQTMATQKLVPSVSQVIGALEILGILCLATSGVLYFFIPKVCPFGLLCVRALLIVILLLSGHNARGQIRQSSGLRKGSHYQPSR
jgi:hypothetical protein